MLTSIFTSASLTLSALLASGFAAPSEINTQILKDLHIHTAECGHEYDPELAAFQQQLIQSGVLPNALDSDEPVQVNVAVWYPPTWLELVGENEVDARIDSMMTRVNRAFADSYVNIQINVVFAKELAYEYRDPNTGELRGSTLYTQPLNVYPWGWGSSYAGLTREVDFPRLTYEYGADMMLWIQERNIDNDFMAYGLAGTNLGATNYVGNAAVVDQGILAGEVLSQDDILGPAYAEIALSATASTVAHEIGHVLSLRHDLWYYDHINDNFPLLGHSTFCGFPFQMRENELLGIEIPFSNNPYSGTVMHGGLVFGAPKHLVFSNPDLLIGADYCGDHEQANQAHVLNSTVAHFTQPKSFVFGYNGAEPIIVEASPIYGQTWLGATLYEASNQRVTVDVHRSGDLSAATHVEVTAFNGTAIAGVDYFGAKLQANFEPGESQTTVVFDVSEDASPDGLFTIRLQYPFGLEVTEQYAIATTGALNDGVHRGDFTIPAAFELTSRELRHIPITRSGDLSRSAVVFARTINGSAKAGQNYQAINQPIYFAPGESSQVIPVYGHHSDGDVEFYVELSSPLNVGFTNERTTVYKLDGYRGQVAFTLDFDDKNYRRLGTSGPNTSTPSDDFDIPSVCGSFTRFDLSDEIYAHRDDYRYLRGFANSPRTFNKVAHCMFNYYYHLNSTQRTGVNQEFSFKLQRYNGSRGDLTFAVRPIGTEDINYHCQDDNPDPEWTDYPYCGSDAGWDPKLLTRDVIEGDDQVFTLADGEESMVVTVRFTDDAAETYGEVALDDDGNLIDHSIIFVVFTEHDELFVNTSEHRFYRQPEAARVYFRHIIAETNDDDNGDDDGNDDGDGGDDSGTTPPPPPPAPPAETKGSSTDFGFFVILLTSALVVRRRKVS